MNSDQTEQDAAKRRTNPAWVGLDERRRTATSPFPTPSGRDSTAEGELKAFKIIVDTLPFDPFRYR